MNEAYLKVEVLGIDKNGGEDLYQVRVRNMDGALVTWVKEMYVTTNVPDKESIQNELLNSIRFIGDEMTSSDALSLFEKTSLYDIIRFNTPEEIINKVRKFKGYPAIGKIYTKKCDGEDVLCMVLGVESNWVYYTDKSRKMDSTMVDVFLRDWTYTGECKEKEVNAIYKALKNVM